jgi:hypothetical protein
LEVANIQFNGKKGAQYNVASVPIPIVNHFIIVSQFWKIHSSQFSHVQVEEEIIVLLFHVARI